MSQSVVLEEKAKHALRMMEKAGFEIRKPIEVAVDEKLPFMGYSAGKRDEHLIVVSGMAVNSGLAEGLLIHEMSHIYRTEAGHPSHNPRVLDAILSRSAPDYELSQRYQREILHQVINHVQDLYADDVAFEVFEKNESELFPLERMSDFFLSWIKTEPVRLADKRRERWINTAALLNNAFALSNMERHGVEDIGNRAKDANQIFLSKVDGAISAKFSYFKAFMIGLKDDMEETEFENQLSEYLDNFLELAERRGE